MNAGPQDDLGIFWEPGVGLRQVLMQEEGRTHRVSDHRKACHQAIAQAFHQSAPHLWQHGMARVAHTVGPDPHGGGFVPLHQPDGIDDVDDQDRHRLRRLENIIGRPCARDRQCRVRIGRRTLLDGHGAPRNGPTD